MRESTITALAVALYATGRLSAEEALVPNKLLEVSINDGERRDIALVDAVISTERFVGARALWKTESLAARLSHLRRSAGDRPVGHRRTAASARPARTRRPGRAVQRRAAPSPPACSTRRSRPAWCAKSASRDWEPMPAGRPFTVALEAGVVALDGERELAFDAGDRVSITLRENAFPTVDVARCMHTAARNGLFRLPSRSRPDRRHPPWHPARTRFRSPSPQLLKAYRTMRTIREFEERLHVDFGRGDIPGFVHLYAGEEAAGTGIMSHLGDGDRIASHAPRPRPLHRQGRRRGRDDERDLRQEGRRLQRQGRLDAHRRPVARE